MTKFLLFSFYTLQLVFHYLTLTLPQGYVTELLLTLEAAVDSLESDFRSLDLMKEIFKSTPNLNNKEHLPGSVAGSVTGSKRSPQTGGVTSGAGTVSVGGGTAGSSPFPGSGLSGVAPHLAQCGHARSTSYSVSYCMRKSSGSPASDTKGDFAERVMFILLLN